MPFPQAAFVMDAIENHFIENQQFRRVGDQAPNTNVLHCQKENWGEWIIFAKGVNTDVGIEFGTGLAQLLRKMDDTRHGNSTFRFGIAMPSDNDDKFKRQCAIIGRKIRRTLNLHWLVVNQDGKVTIYRPDQEWA